MSAKVTKDFHLDDLKKLSEEVRDSVLIRWALLVERLAKLSMRTGGRYTGPRGGKVQMPSIPPDPPHVQTGNLRASITHAKTSKGTWIVGPTRIAWYGKIHEYGGKRHPQRPFMNPAKEASMKELPEIIRKTKLDQTRMGRMLNAKRNPK